MEAGLTATLTPPASRGHRRGGDCSVIRCSATGSRCRSAWWGSRCSERRRRRRGARGGGSTPPTRITRRGEDSRAARRTIASTIYREEHHEQSRRDRLRRSRHRPAGRGQPRPAQAAHEIELDDLVIVERRDDGKIKLHQPSMAGAGAAGGALWGGLIGLIFLMPLFGMAIGAASGAAAGALTDAGVDDKFMKELGEQLTPGTRPSSRSSAASRWTRSSPASRSRARHPDLARQRGRGAPRRGACRRGRRAPEQHDVGRDPAAGGAGRANHPSG